MRSKRSKLLRIILAGWALAGCVGRELQKSEPAAQTVDTQQLEAPQPANSYYWYTEAQLHRKKGMMDQALEHMQTAISLDDESIFLKRELAAILADMKKNDDAIHVLENALQVDPTDVETLKLYGRLNHKLNRIERAKAAFEKTISVDPRQEAIYPTLGRIYLSENNLENAFRVFRRLVEHFPASFVGHFYLGKIHARQERLEEAMRAFEKTLKLEPGLLEPKFELIDLLRSAPVEGETIVLETGQTVAALCVRKYGRYDQTVESAIMAANPNLKDINRVRAGQRLRFPAPSIIENSGRERERDRKIIELYREILRDNPRNVRAAFELGLFYDEIGRTGDAEGLLEELGRRSRTENVILNTVINQYFKNNDYRKTKTALEYMLAGAPESSDIAYLLGLACNEVGDRDAAVKHFRNVAENSRFYENAVVNTALIYQDLKQQDAAMALLKSAIAEKPENADFYLYLGSLYEDREDYPRAEKTLKSGLAVDSENPKLHFRLGVVYDKWGRKKACIAAMKKVIQLEPRHANALNYLGYTYADLGRNLDEAEDLIKRALKEKPEDGYITDSLGWVYYKKGQYQIALTFIKKAVALVPDDPIILEHLGDVYRELGDVQNALKFYRRSLENRKEDSEEIERKIRQLTASSPSLQ